MLFFPSSSHVDTATWMLTKHMEKKLDSNYTRMLRVILNKFWRQHPTKQQLYGHLLPIMKTIQVRQTRYAGHCWRSGDKLISDIFLWTPSHKPTGILRASHHNRIDLASELATRCHHIMR